MIARVVVENAAYSFDIPFSYQVPQQMQPDIRPGCRVLVPFGKANRAKQGLVLALEEGGEQESAPHPKQVLYIDLGVPMEQYDILRRKEDA